MREDNWWEKKKYVKPPHPPFQTGVNKKSLKNICKQYYIVFNWISFFYFCWSMGLMVRPPPTQRPDPQSSLSLSLPYLSTHLIVFCLYFFPCSTVVFLSFHPVWTVFLSIYPLRVFFFFSSTHSPPTSLIIDERNRFVHYDKSICSLGSRWHFFYRISFFLYILFF